MKAFYPVLCLNCGGLSTKFTEICLLIEASKPKLVMLTETHVTELLGDTHFQIANYNVINCYSDSRHTGGVMIYAHSSIKYQVLENEKKNRNWFLAINVSNGMKPGHYGVLYHSPGDSDTEFLQVLEETWLEKFIDLTKFNVLCGDFNIDWSNNHDASRLKLATEAHGLKQLVHEYTRITRTTRTMIDLIFTNCDMNVCVVHDFKISDHETLCMSFDDKSDEPNEVVVKIKCWKKYSQSALLQLIRENSGMMCNDDIHTKASCLVDVLKKCVNKLVVVKIKPVKSSNKWFTIELLEMKRRKDQAYTKHVQLNTNRAWEIYKVHRNEYACTLRRTKREYVQQSIETNKNNTKELWRILKGMISQKSTSAQTITFEETEVHDDAEIAEKFNAYFVDSIEEISVSINNEEEPTELEGMFTENQFSAFRPITREELKSIVWSLEDKSGSDEVSTRILKDAFEALGNTLLEIINESLMNGVVPNSWKESLVVPIEKVQKTIKAEEYRPVNMLPIYEKVLELTVKEQLMEYVSENNLLIPEQSGYRKNHSCESALNLVLAKWKTHLEKRFKVITVFLDLKRAFETISRSKLIQTLMKYGVCETVLQWFSSYLNLRYQKTKYKQVISSAKETKTGVPQGSVLGPLLFILYINDLKRILKHCDINLFADDTVIFIAFDNAIAATEKLNCDLEKLSKWLNHKKLKLNVAKTKYMIISNKSENNEWVNVEINGIPLECVKEFKYLGVIIDEKLCFKSYIDYTVKKIAKKYGVICRLNNELTQWSMVYLYKALISPHFDFCSSIIYLASNQQMYRLQKLQNKVMRLILRCNRRTSVRQMLDALQWLSVKQRVTYQTLLLVHKIANGLAPDYLSSRLERGRDIHSYRTRSADDVRVASFLKASTQNSLFYKGVKLYNSLPRDLREEHSVNVFKRKCVSFVKDNIM